MGVSMDNKERTAARMAATVTENAKRPDGIRLYTLTELEPLLGVTHRTLQAYMKQGRLRGVKLGGKWKITEENLREFLNGGNR